MTDFARSIRGRRVIPTPQLLEEISRQREGRLPETPFAALLLAHAVQQRTVAVEVRRKQVSKRIVFEHGVPIDCRSNLVHETLGCYMVAVGKLPEADLLPYLNQSAARGMPLGEVLLERKVVGAEELFKLLQQNLAKKLLDIFSWRDGEFRLLADVPEPDSPLKVRVPQLIVTGITKYAAAAEVEAGVVPLVGKKLTLHPQPRFSLDEVRLSPTQTQAVTALRSGWRIDELAVGTAMPFEELSRLLYALAVLGLVVTADSLPKRPTGAAPTPRPPAEPPAASPPAVPPPAGAASPAEPDAAAPAAAAERRNEVVQAYLAHRRQDALDLFGLPEDTTLAAVEQAFLAFSRRFAPWTFGGPEQEGIEEKARALYLAAARAYAELVDTEQRHTLLLRRRTLRAERRGRHAPDAFAIKTDLLDSEAQFKKGQGLLEMGRYREALLQLEFAADCDPQNSLYAAALAYCRFLHSPASSGRALGELQETLRRDPECGIALYYSGEIHRQLGQKDEAEALLRRAIKAMSPDRRPIEALKALSADKRR